MLSIKGRFQDGVAQPFEPVEGYDGQLVVITFLEESETPSEQDDNGWERLMQIVERSRMDAGIEDLARQHDHYLYGKPKQD
jgi:hypothetical protein